MTTNKKTVWPPLVSKTFNVEKPVTEYIRDWAEYCPELIALRFYGTDISYGQLNDDINRFANGLIQSGLEKNDRVGLYMQNCPQFVIAFFGVLRAGGIVVSLNPMFKKEELEYELNDAGARIVVAADYLYPEIQKIKERITLDLAVTCSIKDYLPENPCLPVPDEALGEKLSFADSVDFQSFISGVSSEPVCRVGNLEEHTALLQYTGGTTGLPKGAMISHYNLASACLGTIDWWKHRVGDVILGVTPFFHVMGMQQLMCSPLVTGAQVVLLSRFDAKLIVQAIEHYRCSFWVTATTSLIALLETPEIQGADLSSLRILLTGGTPVSEAIQKRIHDLAPRVIISEGYGLTECVSHGGVAAPVLRHKTGYVGIPQLSKVRLVDLIDGESDAAPGEEGEILLKGPTIMQGYWQNPEATRNAIRDGWLYTGDIGVFDDEGYLKIAGRTKELIKCSGFSVFPTEVENLLYKNPAVSQVAVIGVPDDYRGESPKAFIVLKPEYKGKETPDSILAWCKEAMSTYKRPRDVEFLEELPKSAAGKVLHRVLSEKESRKK